MKIFQKKGNSFNNDMMMATAFIIEIHNIFYSGYF